MSLTEEKFDSALLEYEKLKALQRCAQALETLASCVKDGDGGKKYFNTDSGFEY